MTKIGILGGTFDPIHLGHTEPAKKVAEYLSLDKILVIPTSIPPHKATPNVSAKQRAEMVSLACNEACSKEVNFTCDQRELERGGSSYTLDTLKSLKQSYPDQTLYFIIGLDSLLTFTRWHKYQEILSLCHLVVNSRPNYQLTSLNQETNALLVQHQIHDLSTLNSVPCGGIIFITNKTKTSLSLFSGQVNLDISSTDIRKRLSKNQNCQHLLTEGVLDFINKNQLYR